MSRRLLIVVGLVPLLALGGCLPPVEEVTDSTPAAQNAETAEKAVTQNGASTPAGESEPAADAAEGASSGDFRTTASGLKYKIVRPGSDRKPTVADSVSCHYKGWLKDGTVFDSSYDRGEPTEFPLGGVIAGWTEGLQLIGEGGEIELEIPSDLGYGPRGFPPKIPGGATLHFKVELLKVL